MHPRLQPLERRHALLVECDDLAIEDRLIAAGERFGRAMRLGVLLRAVEEIARLEAHFTAIDERERADAVPLRLIGELR